MIEPEAGVHLNHTDKEQAAHTIQYLTTSALANGLRVVAAERPLPEGGTELVCILGLSIEVNDIQVAVAHTFIRHSHIDRFIDALRSVKQEMDNTDANEKSIQQDQSEARH